MAIELSNLTFTEQDDIVPASGVEEIVNTGIANTLAGNDRITGTGGIYSIYNFGTLNTSDGNDVIIGVSNSQEGNLLYGYGILNYGYESIINTGDGNDIIIGIGHGSINDFSIDGILNQGGTINTGDGDDIIIGTHTYSGINNNAESTLDTGNGNDTITGTGSSFGIQNHFTFNTGDGNDKITGTANLSGYGITNIGTMDTGAGNDEITGTNTGTNANSLGIYNFSGNTIDTGDGNDKITGTGASNGIYNNGIIRTGDGKDSIIADGGFNGTGSVFLENGKDYLKGFGNGNFNGGNGQDTLELTSGSYTVGRSGTAVNFTNGSTIMNTSKFEQLIAGGTTYDFNSLTDGQTIFVS
jgi:hypothetical protein